MCIYIYTHVSVSVNVHLYSTVSLKRDSHMLIAPGEDGERERRGMQEKIMKKDSVRGMGRLVGAENK